MNESSPCWKAQQERLKDILIRSEVYRLQTLRVRLDGRNEDLNVQL